MSTEAARAIVNAAMSEYHRQPVDCWAASDGPGAFAEIMARHVAGAMAAQRVSARARAIAECAEIADALIGEKPDLRAEVARVRSRALLEASSAIRALFPETP